MHKISMYSDELHKTKITLGQSACSNIFLLYMIAGEVKLLALYNILVANNGSQRKRACEESRGIQPAVIYTDIN